MSPVVVTEICPSCQRPRSVHEMIISTGWRQCVDCWYRHEEALKALAGHPPKECSECHMSWDEMRARGQDRMAVHMENGAYRIMCMDCDRVYVPKRRELYGPTEFGWKHKLN